MQGKGGGGATQHVVGNEEGLLIINTKGGTEWLNKVIVLTAQILALLSLADKFFFYFYALTALLCDRYLYLKDTYFEKILMSKMD